MLIITHLCNIGISPYFFALTPENDVLRAIFEQKTTIYAIEKSIFAKKVALV